MEQRRRDPLDIRRFGAVPDGQTSSTAAIQRAIDTCGRGGGGMVVVPPGRYLSGALFLRSHVHLHLAAGSSLIASQRPADFPPIPNRWEGIEQLTHSSLLTGVDLDEVSVTGDGILDGQGMPWWAAADATRKLRILRNLPREAPNPPGAPLRWPRPRVVNLMRCRRSRLAGFAIRHPPAWSIHLLYCEDAVVDGVAIAGLQAYNSCGIILDSCRRVRVAQCLIAAGADCLGIKAGYNADGRRVGLPSEDITVQNCNLTFAAGSGFAVGSETAGGIRNVTIENCIITNCKTGITIRSTRGRGGVIERITARNLVMDRLTNAAVVVTEFFDSVRQGFVNPGEPPPPPNPETDRTSCPPPDEGTPTVRDVAVSNLTVGDVPHLATIEGLPERFVEGIRMTDVRATAVTSGITILRARDVTISGITLEPRDRPAVTAQHVERLEIHRLRCASSAPRVPLIQLEDTTAAFIHGCAPAATAPLLALEGPANRDVILGANAPP
jgi:polygalacturonase